MKQFLYLDMDIVNSILAQNNMGLVEAFTTEQENLNQKNNIKSVNVELDGNAETKVLMLAKAEASIGINASFESGTENRVNSKSIIAKSLHDAAFCIAYDVIFSKKVDKEICTGDYVEIKREFVFVDFDYLEKLFSKDGIVEFIKKEERERIEVQSDDYMNCHLNREQKRSAEKRGVSNTVKNLQKQNDQKYDDIYKVLSALGRVVPYGRMLVSDDGYLIPLDEKNFRVNPASVGFMYGGMLNCVGLVTNMIKNNDKLGDGVDDLSNPFAKMNNAVNQTLMSILSVKTDTLFVISPIAIYYDSVC